MKVKHTKNGNVKLVMDLEQATALRAFLMMAYRLRPVMDMEQYHLVCNVDDEMSVAGIDSILN